MIRDDVKVIENLYAEEGYPHYYVVPAKGIKDYSETGEDYDYSLVNEQSECWYDLQKAIEEKFNVNTGYMYLYGCDNEIEDDSGEIDDKKLAEINEYAKDWRKEHEIFNDYKFYNYFDGSNWQSLLLDSDNLDIAMNLNYKLLSDDEAKDKIAAYDRAEDSLLEYNYGYAEYKDEETGFTVRFSQFSNAVGFAEIFD